MKILFLSPSAQLGGAERILLDIIASLADQLPRESSMHLIAPGEGPLLEAARNLGAQIHVLPMPARMASLGDSALRDGERNRGVSLWRGMAALPSTTGYVRALRRIVRAIRPDIIHSNGMKTHVLSRFLITAAPGAALVWQIHDLLAQRQVMGKILRRFAGRVSIAIAISKAVEQEVRVALPKTCVATILNGIDVDHFAPGDAQTAELDSLAGFGHRKRVIRIGLIATYARWKGHELFIDAAALALRAAQRPELCFYLIGGPIYATEGSQFSRAELSQRVARHGISDRFGFVDFQSDPLLCYRALDVVVHAGTRPELFGRSIAEAMACGRAVIVTRGGGASELFTDGVDAIGIPQSDPMALSEAVLRVAGDPTLRQRLGDSARATALQKFDRRRMGLELLAVFTRLISR